jgi:molybdopterin synthase sulfur carrier subunit
MPTVFIPAPLRSLTSGAPTIELAGSTVRDLVAALDTHFPGIAAHLSKDGQLSPNLMVSIDGAVSPRGLLASVQSNSEVHFLPAIGGG